MTTSDADAALVGGGTTAQGIVTTNSGGFSSFPSLAFTGIGDNVIIQFTAGGMHPTIYMYTHMLPYVLFTDVSTFNGEYTKLLGF